MLPGRLLAAWLRRYARWPRRTAIRCRRPPRSAPWRWRRPSSRAASPPCMTIWLLGAAWSWRACTVSLCAGPHTMLWPCLCRRRFTPSSSPGLSATSGPAPEPAAAPSPAAGTRPSSACHWVTAVMRTIRRPPQGPADRAGSAGRLGPVAAEERPDRGQQPGRVIALHVVARVRDGDHRGVADQGRERGGLVGGEQVAIGAAEDQVGQAMAWARGASAGIC